MSFLLMFINNFLCNVFVHQSWENLGTMDASSRRGVTPAIYKEGDKEDIAK